MAGELVKARAAASGARIIPIDSEHSALWQCLRGEDPASVSRLVLTASGGPFLQRPLDTFASITPAEALAHPTWNMGPKVTIDSATMMNKGLEVIEAHFLFDVPYAVDRCRHPADEHRAQLGRVPRWSGGRADGCPGHACADRARACRRRTPPRRRAAPRPSRRVAARIPPSRRRPLPGRRAGAQRRRARRPRALRLQRRERGGGDGVHRRTVPLRRDRAAGE